MCVESDILQRTVADLALTYDSLSAEVNLLNEVKRAEGIEASAKTGASLLVQQMMIRHDHLEVTTLEDVLANSLMGGISLFTEIISSNRKSEEEE